MREGWSGDDYLIVCDQSEVPIVSDRYAISQWLPGYQVIGLRGWDDFIVQDRSGNTFCVPTVPALQEYLSPFVIPECNLDPDPRFSGKIKWYVMPIAFGGDPQLGTNIVWVTQEQHAQLVKWWNDKYRELVTARGSNSVS